jgi:soluble lytic murein transglycosylase
MSTSSRTAIVSRSRNAPARRRTTVRRRRRRLSAAVLLAGLAAAVVAAMPLFRKAYNDLTLPLQYQSIIRQEAVAEHLPPPLIAAVIYAETKFDPRTSPAGAEGLMQIEPATADFLARRSGATSFHVSDLSTPAVNIDYGSYYLRYLLNEYGNNLVLALAAYNGGETNVNTWLAKVRSRGRSFDVDDIPFPETRAYVEKVLGAEKAYRNTYPRQLSSG